MRNKSRVIALMLLFCIISSSFFMITSFTLINVGNSANSSAYIKEDPITRVEIKSDGSVPNITAIWFNGSLFNSSVLWNVTSNQMVNITANITSADKLLDDSTLLYYDTNLTDEIFPIPVRLTNTTDFDSPPLDNNTINNVSINGTTTVNDFHAVSDDDGILHVIQNGTNGILIPYSINLTDLGYENDFDLQDRIEIGIEATITTTNNSYAGLMIWNWTSNSLVDVSSSWFNSTSYQERSFTIGNNSQFNITDLVSNGNNSRIELFIKVTSNMSIGIAIDYVYFHVKKDPKAGIYSAFIPGLPWDKNNDPSRKSPVFFWINVTDEDGTNSTIQFKDNYSIVDLTPPQVEFSIVNHSYVSGIVSIQLNVTDMESGIQNISLTIDKNKTYNQSKVWSYSDILAQDPNVNNVTFTYNWNVTGFSDYNGTNAPENATHVINFTIWNRAGIINMGIDQNLWETRYETKANYTVYIDNNNPYDPYLNVRSNDEGINYLNFLSNFEISNTTNTDLILNATNCGNDTSSIINYDNNYHIYHNASQGILMPYAVDLSSYGYGVLDDIKSVQITVAVNTSAANSALEIFNYSSNSLVNVSKLDGTFTNNYTIIISRSNLSAFINETENSRFELFINASDSSLSDYTVFVKYIGVNVTYYKKYEWYSDISVETNMSIRVGGNDDISYQQIKVYANDVLIFTWINSTNLTKGSIIYDDYVNNYVTFNSSLISDGEITIKAVILDNASNENITTQHIKIDNSGPSINFNYANNSAFSNDGSWNWMIDLGAICEDSISEISFVEMKINGTVPTVADGQKYQVITYDEFGNVTYRQENASWYEDNENHIFLYYWNATTYQALDTFNITIYAEDLLGNSNSSIYFINKANYTMNLSVERADLSEIGYSESSFQFTVLLNNTGNSTLYNFTFSLSLPTGWSYHYQFDNKVHLDPGQITQVIIIITPLTATTDSFDIQITVKCYSYEYAYFSEDISIISNFIVTILPKNYEDEILVGLIIFGIIVGGVGLGVFFHFLNRTIKRSSRRLKVIQEQPKAKSKK
ncbi:MAG: hypothetical protein ACTSX4_08370 [Candidatus Helarchaeota archaeon]